MLHHLYKPSKLLLKGDLYPLSREIELNKWVKAYLFKGGSVAQKQCNAFTSSSDAFAKIGQAIAAILTQFTLGSIQ